VLIAMRRLASVCTWWESSHVQSLRHVVNG
jgi:hypothetical protein